MKNYKSEPNIFPTPCDVNSQRVWIFQFACYGWDIGEFFFWGLLVSVLRPRQSCFCCVHPQCTNWGTPWEFRSLALAMYWLLLFVCETGESQVDYLFPSSNKGGHHLLFFLSGLLSSVHGFVPKKTILYLSCLQIFILHQIILSVLYPIFYSMDKLPDLCVMSTQETIIQVSLQLSSWYFDNVMILLMWCIAIPYQF